MNPDFPTLLSPAQARALVLENIVAGPRETLAHDAALGRVLAADVVSEIELPPFDNSAMDGYAVRPSNLQNAPTTLRQLEIVGAGAVPNARVEAGTCVKIMTGAPLPQGAEAVVMREETRATNDGVWFENTAQAGQNIRRAGSDVARGETVLRAGTRVRAAEWAMLAALGQSKVEVFARPRVAIITTGEELIGVGDELSPGQIRDSNGPALRALCLSAGADVVAERHVGDAPDELRAVLDELIGNCDLILTSGGVSAGDFDPVRDVLLGQARVIFWKVAMKPGKPLLFAFYRDVPILALPGNPASVMVTWEEFARPAILKRGGAQMLLRLEVRARLSETLKSAPGRVEFVRARVSNENGELVAHAPTDQGSGRLSTMTRANALLVIEADQTELPAGTFVTARLIDGAEAD